MPLKKPQKYAALFPCFIFSISILFSIRCLQSIALYFRDDGTDTTNQLPRMQNRFEYLLQIPISALNRTQPPPPVTNTHWTTPQSTTQPHISQMKAGLPPAKPRTVTIFPCRHENAAKSDNNARQSPQNRTMRQTNPPARHFR